ncbi:serine/threonine-protein phosphatase [Streptomyces sp. A3M-1-3]|nr:serine/threonine-protein phosphatase [Streptomyces sp. A3M-1-3]
MRRPGRLSATGIIGHIDHRRTFRWACAGHPPPMLLRRGTVSLLDSEHRSPLFGVLPGHQHTTATDSLRDGDLLLFYTDGMVERRGEDITEGIGVLRETLLSCDGLTPQRAQDTIVAGYAGEALEDGTCLLALQVGS